MVEFKMSDFITLPKLLQRLGWVERDKSRAAIAMVFVYPSQVLSDIGYILKHSTFKSFQLPVSRKNCGQITNIIIQLYKDKLQSQKQETNMKKLI